MRLAYHPASVVKRTRFVLLFVSALVMVGATCTNETTTTTTPPSPTGSPLPTVDVPVDFVEGEYTYENFGVVVHLSWDGGAGEMTIENGSGKLLETPGLYAVTREQTQVPADIPDAAPIPAGEQVTLEVVFPDSLSHDDAGLIALTFGDDNWGALAPVIKEK